MPPIAASGALTPTEQEVVPDELLVQFRAHVTEAQKEDARKRGNAKFEERINRLAQRYGVNLGDLDLVKLPPGISLQQAMAVLENHPAVRFAEPNQVRRLDATTSDPAYTDGTLWGMQGDVSAPSNQYGSQAAEAWTEGYTGSAAVYVGVIDTGIQFDHPDLQGQIWTNPWDAVDGVDNDGNGLIDDVHGWDFWSRSAATPTGDNTIYDNPLHDDHGTHVSGTIGGKNDGSGVVGVNWNVTIISSKFLGGTSGSGTLSNQVLAMDYITNLKVLHYLNNPAHGLNIVATNNSYGAKGYAQSEYDAIERAAQANILTISAAGNGGSDQIGDNNDLAANAFYPASYDTTPSVGYDASISVAAITNGGALASFSNYGVNSVDLGAPGAAIYSSIPAGAYDSWNGTSMATPHVTGAAALFAAANPGATAEQIHEALLSTTAPTPSLASKTATGGRLDISVLMGLNAFVSAVPVSSLPRQFSANTTNATVEAGEPTATACGTTDKTVWYSYTPSSPTLLTVSTANSSFDTLVAVYTGSAVDALTPVLGATGVAVCNDTFADGSAGGSPQARVTFVAATGTTYRIQAGGASGASGNLAVAFSGVAAPPDGLAIVNTTGNSQTLAWNDLVGEKGYRVERRTGGGAWKEVSKRNANVTSYVSSGLVGATTYDYRVRAVNANNSFTGYSVVVSGATLPPPDAPASLIVDQATTNSLTVTWPDVAGEDGYRIERRAANSTKWRQVNATSGPNVTSYVNTGLSAGTTYVYRVRAFNSAGTSAPSPETSAATLPLMPIAAPTNLEVIDPTVNSLTVTWIDTANNEAGFRLDRKTGSGSWNQIKTLPANATSFTNTGLSAATEYLYRVRAYNSGGNSAYTSETPGVTSIP